MSWSSTEPLVTWHSCPICDRLITMHVPAERLVIDGERVFRVDTRPAFVGLDLHTRQCVG